MSSDATQERGSHKMLRERFGVKPFIEEEEVERLMNILTKEEIKLNNILVRGIPAVEYISAVVQVSLAEAGALAGELSSFGCITRLFPYGIPVIEGVLMQVENGARE